MRGMARGKKKKKKEEDAGEVKASQTESYIA